MPILYFGRDDRSFFYASKYRTARSNAVKSGFVHIAGRSVCRLRWSRDHQLVVPALGLSYRNVATISLVGRLGCDE